jgi:hypothetical protein
MRVTRVSAEPPLGMGFGDRFKVSQGDSGVFEGGVHEVGKRLSCRENAVASAVPQSRLSRRETSMVRTAMKKGLLQ